MDDRPTIEDAPESDEEKWPVGFLIIVTLAVLYLGWRAIQAIGWVLEKL